MELVVMENVPPILAERVRYYQDPAFMDRLKGVSPQLQALGASACPPSSSWIGPSMRASCAHRSHASIWMPTTG